MRCFQLGLAAVGALALSGCSEEPVTSPPAEVPAAVTPEVERSPDELEPVDPPDPVEASGAFAGARHQAALAARAADPAQAAALFEQACDRGFAPSCLALADMLASGEGVEADPDGARGLLEQACMDGSTDACDRLGH